MEIPVGYHEKENTPMDKWYPERVHQNRLTSPLRER